MENSQQKVNQEDNLNQDPPSSNPISNQKGNFLLIIGVIVLVLVIGVGAYYFGTKQTQQTPTISQTTPTGTEVKTLPTASTPSQIPDTVPQVNSVYLGSYQGKEALFLTNTQLQEYYEAGVKKTSPYIGELRILDGIGKEPFDYKELQNPKRIFTDTSGTIMDIGWPKFNNTKSYLYISANFQGTNPNKYPNITTKIYQINLNDLSSKQLWTGEIGSDKYEQKGGAGISQVVDDKYIVLQIGVCYACEGFDPAGVVIVNVANDKEKYLGAVGDLQFDLNNNTVSYKKLTPFKESCEPSPGCDNDGKRTVYKPSGQVMTNNLP